MGVIKARHVAYREANIVLFAKRHKGLRFAGTAKVNKKGGKVRGT
jgi:hypothetical protein